MGAEDMDIIWLASYPKSGNTWLRFFLTALYQGSVDSSARVQEFIPEIGGGHEHEAYTHTGQTLVKTHLSYNEKLHSKGRTHGFIYIVRNPLDVMLSCYNYHLYHLGDEPDVSEDRYRIRYARHFVKHLGDEDWIDLGYGNLLEHVMSWTQEAPKHHPHLILRYEDMLHNPYQMAHMIASFLKLSCTEESLQEALDFASFKNMRAMEERELKEGGDTLFNRERVGIGYQKGKRFMNKGKANRKHEIPLGARREAQKLFAPIIKHFAYA